MEKERSAKKVSSSREKGLSQGFPLDLNLLHLQNSKNKDQINHPGVAFDNTSSISPRNKPRMNNREAAKLGHSKSCEVPTLLSDESWMSKRKARRSFSAPDTLDVPVINLETFSFERPVYEHSNTAFYDNNTEEHVVDDNLHLGFKLPAICIHSTHCRKQGKRDKNTTASTAGIDFRLPYIKSQRFHRY